MRRLTLLLLVKKKSHSKIPQQLHFKQWALKGGFWGNGIGMAPGQSHFIPVAAVILQTYTSLTDLVGWFWVFSIKHKIFLQTFRQLDWRAFPNFVPKNLADWMTSARALDCSKPRNAGRELSLLAAEGSVWLSLPRKCIRNKSLVT